VLDGKGKCIRSEMKSRKKENMQVARELKHLSAGLKLVENLNNSVCKKKFVYLSKHK